MLIFQRGLALAGALRHVDGHLQRGGAGALADPRLQHPQLALLDGELGVAHVAVVTLEAVEDVDQLGVDLREVALQIVEVSVLRMPATTSSPWALIRKSPYGLFSPVAALRVKPDAGAAELVAVAEHHRLHVDGGAEVVADALADAVGDGPSAVPAREHGLDRATQLLGRVLRERLAGLGLDDLLVVLAQLLQRARR